MQCFYVLLSNSLQTSHHLHISHWWIFKCSMTSRYFPHLPQCFLQFMLHAALLCAPIKFSKTFAAFSNFPHLGSIIEWKYHWWFLKFLWLLEIFHIYRIILSSLCNQLFIYISHWSCSLYTYTLHLLVCQCSEHGAM